MDIHHRGQALIQLDRMARPGADRQALLIGRAGLFQIQIQPLCRTGESNRLVPAPCAVHVAHPDLARLPQLHQGAHKLPIHLDVMSQLDLKVEKAPLPEIPEAFRHRLRLCQGHDPMQRDGLAHQPAQQRIDRQSSCLAKQVPTRQINRRFGRGLTIECLIHLPHQSRGVPRVLADHTRRQHLQASRQSLGERRHITRPTRADLAIALQTGIGGKNHDGAGEVRVGTATGERIGGAVIGELTAVDCEGFNAHSRLHERRRLRSRQPVGAHLEYDQAARKTTRTGSFC